MRMEVDAGLNIRYEHSGNFAAVHLYAFSEIGLVGNDDDGASHFLEHDVSTFRVREEVELCRGIRLDAPGA